MRSHAKDPPSAPPLGPYEALAIAVQRRRKALSLTQEDLGLLAGCGRLFVHRLEHAKSSLRLDKVLAVLTVLGLQLEVRGGQKGLIDCSDEAH